MPAAAARSPSSVLSDAAPRCSGGPMSAGAGRAALPSLPAHSRGGKVCGQDAGLLWAHSEPSLVQWMQGQQHLVTTHQNHSPAMMSMASCDGSRRRSLALAAPPAAAGSASCGTAGASTCSVTDTRRPPPPPLPWRWLLLRLLHPLLLLVVLQSSTATFSLTSWAPDSPRSSAAASCICTSSCVWLRSSACCGCWLPVAHA